MQPRGSSHTPEWRSLGQTGGTMLSKAPQQSSIWLVCQIPASPCDVHHANICHGKGPMGHIIWERVQQCPLHRPCEISLRLSGLYRQIRNGVYQLPGIMCGLMCRRAYQHEVDPGCEGGDQAVAHCCHPASGGEHHDPFRYMLHAVPGCRTSAFHKQCCFKRALVIARSMLLHSRSRHSWQSSSSWLS